jgi:chemotaxis protein MotB
MTLLSRHHDRNEMGRNGTGHGQSRTLWLYTLSDLMSLLLCFFVLLFAMTQTQKGDWQRVFGTVPQDDTAMTAEDRSDLEATRNAAALADARDANYLQALMTERMTQLSLDVPVTVSRVPDGVLLAMPAEDLFATGAARDGASLATELKPLAGLLASVPNALSIVLSSPRSASADAWRSSLARGQAFADALAQAGLDHIGAIETRDLAGPVPQIALLLRDRETVP